MKVGTLLKDHYDNLYVVAGEEANYKESTYPLLKTVKIWCINRNIFVYPVRRIVENDFEVLSP